MQIHRSTEIIETKFERTLIFFSFYMFQPFAHASFRISQNFRTWKRQGSMDQKFIFEQFFLLKQPIDV